jgi:hypothetical protein
LELQSWLKPFLDHLGHKARQRMCRFVAELIGLGDRKGFQLRAERLAPGDCARGTTAGSQRRRGAALKGGSCCGVSHTRCSADWECVFARDVGADSLGYLPGRDFRLLIANCSVGRHTDNNHWLNHQSLPKPFIALHCAHHLKDRDQAPCGGNLTSTRDDARPARSEHCEAVTKDQLFRRQW